MSERAEPLLGTLAQAPSYAAFRRGWGRRERALFQAAADAVARQSRSDPARAAVLAARLRQWAEDSGEPYCRALALRATGNVDFVRGANAAAVKRYRQALAEFERAGDRLEAGRTWSSLLHPLALLGDRAASAAAASAARRCFRACADRPRLARLDINIASLRLREGNCTAALAALDRAWSVLQGGDDHEALVAIHGTRAAVLIQLARFEEAEASYGAARAMALRHGMPVLASQADYNIGALYFQRGQYAAALQMLDRARATAARFEDRWHEALCDLDQADIYLELNQVEETQVLGQRALEHFRHLQMPYEEGKALTLLALAERALGGDASARLQEAQGCFARSGNEFWVHVASLHQAATLTARGEFELALALAARAERFFAGQQAVTKVTYAALLAAEAELAAGRRERAHSCLERARTQLGALQAPWLRVQLHALEAQAAEAAGEAATALAAYERALAAAESTRGGLDFDELRLSFMRDKSALYGRSLALMLDLGAPAERCWLHMERARLQALAPRGASAATGTRSQAVQTLREELNWLYRRLQTERAATPALYEHIQERERALLRRLRKLPARSGGFYEQPSPALLERVRAHLGAATLIEYFGDGDELAAAIVDARGVGVVRLRARLDELETSVRRLRFHLARQAAQGPYFDTNRLTFARALDRHLAQLAAAVFDPLRGQLQSERVVIVPHGVLHAVPFAALLSGGRALAEEFALSIAPSATFFALCSEQPPSPHTQWLLVAAEPAAAADEVRAVGAGRRQCRLLVGAASTRRALLRGAARSSRLHIAAHGIFRADSPYFSALALADGHLPVSELRSLRLAADLVVLSGCGTALGDIDAGDDVIGLTRTFLAAGARHVIGSLWDVDDQITAEFMSALYAQLDRQAPAAALRAASLAIRERHPHPFYWAPFQVSGAI